MPDPIRSIDFPCPACGYNLRGLPHGNRCPECGRPAGSDQTGAGFGRADEIDAEIDERLSLEAEAAGRRQKLDELIAAWEERGRRLDRIMSLAEEFLRPAGNGK